MLALAVFGQGLPMRSKVTKVKKVHSLEVKENTTNKRTQRRCLKCNCLFYSRGIENRLCSRCALIVAETPRIFSLMK